MRRAFWPAVAVLSLAFAVVSTRSAGIAARGAGFTLAVASLVVLTGWSGQLNLHVAAIGLGLGAYAAAGLAAYGVPPLLAIVLAPVVAAPVALVIGAVAVRFRGLELAIATLAAGLAFEQSIAQSLGKALARTTTGSAFESSLIELARPSLLRGDRAFALFAVLLAGAWLFVAHRAGRGAPGRALRAIRDAEVVAEARGVPVTAWRIGAFVLATSIAATGGALLAGQTGAVTPDAFGLFLSLQIFAVAMLAGIRRLEAAAIGGAVLLLSTEVSALGDASDLIAGAGLIAALFWHARRRPRIATATDVHVDAAVEALRPQRTGFAPTVLRAENIAVSFGSLDVLGGASLRVGAGEVCGLIGGNGAGKTTLFNVITGLIAPDAGRVFVCEQDVTEMAPHRRARLGLARTFQGVELFENLTVADGLLVAAHASDAEQVRAALHELGIGSVAGRTPAELPFATLRLVEIATALVADPALLLLDEPLAGLDARERARVLLAIDGLRARGRAVLLVEHDLASVEQIADRTYVLDAGRTVERRKEVARAARA